jgi:hypothetical protein
MNERQYSWEIQSVETGPTMALRRLKDWEGMSLSQEVGH